MRYGKGSRQIETMQPCRAPDEHHAERWRNEDWPSQSGPSSGAHSGSRMHLEDGIPYRLNNQRTSDTTTQMIRLVTTGK